MSPPTPSTRRAGLLINRNFALLWLGQGLSVIGDYVYNTALVLWVAKTLLPASPLAPLAVGGIYVATIIPQVLVAPAAGVFADRWDKRCTMLRMDAVRTGIIALLVLATGVAPLPFLAGGRLSPAQALIAIYAVIFIAESCGQFFIPARMTLIADIVADEHRPRAVGLNQVTQNLAIVVGPPIAAALFFSVGVAWTLWLNAISFAVSFLCVLAIRAPKIAAGTGLARDRPASGPAIQQRPNFLRELREGLHFVVRDRTVRPVIIGGMIVMFGAAPLNTLAIFFLQQNLHAPAQLLGYLDSALGIGAIAGAVLWSVTAGRIGLVRLFILSLFGAGVGIIVFARLTSYTPALIMFGVVGVAQAGINIAVGPLLYRATPRALLGRVSSLLNPSVGLAIVAGVALSGALDGTVLHTFHLTVAGLSFGPLDTLYLASGLLIILGAIYLLSRLGLSDPPPAEAAQSAEAEPAAVTADASG